MINNAAERRVWAVAVGRRNWTFCGSDRGGDLAAAMYTLIQTCRLNDVDPHACLRDVIAQIRPFAGMAYSGEAYLPDIYVVLSLINVDKSTNYTPAAR
jgi:hypothetical protein